MGCRHGQENLSLGPGVQEELAQLHLTRAIEGSPLCLR